MPTWDDLNWLPCEEVCARLSDLPDKPGAYAVRCAPEGKPKRIQRAFGPDDSGILCFGKTEEGGLRTRLTNLCRALRGMRAPHAEGRRYHDVKYAGHGFPLDSLQIGWIVCASMAEAKAGELAWFDEYFEQFGELPPLNRKRG